MSILYTAGIRLYNIAVRIASLRGGKPRRLLEGRSQTLATIAARRIPDREYYWFHVASLGEFEQARPLIEALKSSRPDVGIAVTFFSPSGYEVRHNYPQADIIAYFPSDTPAQVKKFLDALRPAKAIFVKYEFWGNMLHELRHRGIPTYLICAVFRPGQIFFRPWGGYFRSMLRCFNHIFVQDERSAGLLAGIGIRDVTVAGDTRFDRVDTIRREARDTPALAEFCDGRFTLMAGSSWPADEQIYLPWFDRTPQARLVIAPHEFDNQRLENLRRIIRRPTALLSEIESGRVAAGDVDCIIVDCFGRLAGMYRYASVAYVGGGFGVGIHNINEAAVYSVPVIFGPEYRKFIEAHELIACRGAFTVSSAGEFDRVIDTLLHDPDALKTAGTAAGRYIASRLGATERILPALS